MPPLVPGKKPEDTTVVVAMSGGVDSSCVAALCQKAGYKTIGMTLQLWDYQGQTDGEGKRLGTCCALDDVYDAKLVCKTIGIEHITLKVEDVFKEAVIDDFVETYLAGATPIPCVRCNQRIKFSHMLDKAKALGVDVIATGHYVQKDWVNGKGVLKKAVDDTKDQTYYLFATTQEQLDMLAFPLGGITKNVTRQLAEELGLHVHVKPDSQDICFVPGKDYRKVVKKFAPEAEKPGNIMLEDGSIVGQHDGIIGYTVGQRKGVPGGYPQPMYVVEIKADENQVVIGPKGSLAKTTFTVKDVNWLADTPPNELDVMVRIRAQHASALASLKDLENNRIEVTFYQPEEQISPGQAAVFYDEEGILLGGGWIEPVSAVKVKICID
ncbi:MAG: tRNA 2-thiouridine(34) synthase MnmA [Alphaproteobacteria bacterium]|nr:tRNA 2-thiouridine(34) synthase MnmA [Alphaproteobacteria bacterium]